MWCSSPKSLITFFAFLAFISATLALSAPSAPHSQDLDNPNHYNDSDGSNGVVTVIIKACVSPPASLSSNGGSLTQTSISSAISSSPYVSASESSGSGSTTIWHSTTSSSTESRTTLSTSGFRNSSSVAGSGSSSKTKTSATSTTISRSMSATTSSTTSLSTTSSTSKSSSTSSALTSSITETSSSVSIPSSSYPTSWTSNASSTTVPSYTPSSSISTQTSSTSAPESSTTISLTATTTSTLNSSSSTTSNTKSSQTSSSAVTSKSTSSSASRTSVSSSSVSTKSSTTSTHKSSTKSSTTSTRTKSASSTTSTSPTPTCAYWMEDIKHQGLASFNPNKGSYLVFRNVKDYNAKGDGVTDDTDAINNAIKAGNRCGPATCTTSTITPAIVYFPPGTYLVSGSIIDYYNTQIIGNPKCLPVIKGASNLTARWIIDGDQYQPGGALGFGNLATNVFWRQIRNFIIDMTDVPSIRPTGSNPGSPVAGIHWPTAQATSLQNIVFLMSESPNTGHEGIFLESGSGGFMTDLVFYGGQYGMEVANQQFTMRNLTFFNANTAIHQLFDWGWTYKGVSINNCSIGIDMTSLNNGVQSVGSVILIDSDISNTPIGIAVSRDATSTPVTGGTLILENVRLNNVPVAVQAPGKTTVLVGSTRTKTIAAWAEGHVYLPSGPTVFQGEFTPNSRPSSLTAGTDYYERSKPQYENVRVSEFISVRSAGAKGDGVTDDSDALIAVISEAALTGKIVFFDAGYYRVTKTIYIPSGSRVTGEAYPVIMSSGAFFNDMSKPQPVVKVGKPGEKGTVEWSDMLVSTQGAQAGAILIQWNLDSSATTPAGMWDVHSRIGGFAGSQLQVSQCPKTPDVQITSASQVPSQCIAAFLDMHITESAAGIYMENVWLWVADHDADDAGLTQISVYAGRGLLIESAKGGNWLYGTSVEHHTLYQYQLTNTVDIFLGFIQTETAYYQPNPTAPIPFTSETSLSDPVFSTGTSQSGWGLRVIDSSSVLIYGAGHYSFFSDYNVTCSNQGAGETCQKHIVDISQSDVSIYGLNTVGTTEMITLNGMDRAPAADNDDGFVSTIAIFRTSHN